MSVVFRCDGCGKELVPGSAAHAIKGGRANRTAGGGIPYGDFDWCLACARLAFAAVPNARKASEQ